MITAVTSVDKIKRKTKIDLKPRKLARAPPRTGPIAIEKLRTAGICKHVYHEVIMEDERAYWLDRS